MGRKESEPLNQKIFSPRQKDIQSAIDQLIATPGFISTYNQERSLSLALNQNYSNFQTLIESHLLKIPIYKKNTVGSGTEKTGDYLFKNEDDRIVFYNPIAATGVKRKYLTSCNDPGRLLSLVALTINHYFLQEAIRGNLFQKYDDLYSAAFQKIIENNSLLGINLKKTEKTVKGVIKPIVKKMLNRLRTLDLYSAKELYHDLYHIFRMHGDPITLSDNAIFLSIGLIAKYFGFDSDPYRTAETIKRQHQRARTKR
jgi:hypothetical protein